MVSPRILLVGLLIGLARCYLRSIGQCNPAFLRRPPCALQRAGAFGCRLELSGKPAATGSRSRRDAIEAVILRPGLDMLRANRGPFHEIV
jgi:hypothetical protein